MPSPSSTTTIFEILHLLYKIFNLFLQHGQTISNVFVSQLQQLNELNTIYPSTPLCSSLSQLLILSFHLSAFVRIPFLTDLTTQVFEPYVMTDLTSYMNLFFDIPCVPFTTKYRQHTVECLQVQSYTSCSS